jgi:hypothetical protein
MSVTFSYVHNIITKDITFDIVDMEYPYNAIIDKGTLNAFEAILHLPYLCMKISCNKVQSQFMEVKRLQKGTKEDA